MPLYDGVGVLGKAYLGGKCPVVYSLLLIVLLQSVQFHLLTAL
jgi:hypothetical protein